MATSAKTVGLPVKLLHEATGHVVTVELKTGEIYRGELFEAEDNWNCQLKDVTATGRDGRVSQLDHLFVRGRCVHTACGGLMTPNMLCTWYAWCLEQADKHPCSCSSSCSLMHGLVTASQSHSVYRSPRHAEERTNVQAY